MKRREFIMVLGGALACPFVARAQQAHQTFKIAVLTANKREAPQNIALLDEMRREGFIEGQNLVVRGFGLRTEEVAEFAIMSVKEGADAILCGGGPATRAAQAATRTVPIVSVTDDMIAEGLVRSLARPSGNTTGISILAPELDGKRQDLLMEAAPGARHMAALVDRKVQSPQQLETLQRAARAHQIDLSIYPVMRPEEIGPAIDAAKAAGVAALNALRLVQVVEDTTMLVSGYEHQTWQCSGCDSVEQRTTFSRKKPKPFDEKLRNFMERATALKEAAAESKRRAQFKHDWDKLPLVPPPSVSSEALNHKDCDEPVRSPEKPAAAPAPTAHDEPITSPTSECARNWTWTKLVGFGRHKGSVA